MGCGVSTSKVLTYTSKYSESDRKIHALTWNISSVNNNPFEYWLTYGDPSYIKTMKSVSDFILNPGLSDVKIKEIFTDVMFYNLLQEMKLIGWTGMEETVNAWENEYKNRKIISEFITDTLLGKKRLVSMADRVTNSITTANEGIVARPTVINCFSGDLSTISQWWSQWKEFMFHKEILIKKKDIDSKLKIYQLINPIQRAKYPAITEQEEKISKLLQTLNLAIFDCILVHMMNAIAFNEWQLIRKHICDKLIHKKLNRTLEILETTYQDATVIFLQEVASSFSQSSKNRKISTLYEIYSSSAMDYERDQNSYILLKINKYQNIIEITTKVISEVELLLAKDRTVPIMNGDLFVIHCQEKITNQNYLFASFHGDTNGLSTILIVQALYNYYTKNYLSEQNTILIFGLDANTYSFPCKDQQGVKEFGEFYTSLKLTSCHGPVPDIHNYTTFHARSHLQPQLNKALTFEEKNERGDKEPKDFILFFYSQLNVVSTAKDNTGDRRYIDDMMYPTLSFPSDHAIVATVLEPASVSVSV